jgi:hypothetical protein
MASRPPIEQSFFNVTLAVATSPTPLSTVLDLNNMIQTFIVCNPSFNSNSVFIGDSNVSASSAGPTIGTGVEILTGTSQKFVIREERQMYELQNPLMLFLQKYFCQPMDIDYIPVVAWKPNNVYLIAAVATSVSIMFFRNVYV